MIKVLLLLILLPILFILTVSGIILSVRPIREAFLRYLGKRMARSAQSGRWRMEVRTWRFEAPHTRPRQDFMEPSGERDRPLRSDGFRQLKDVTPTNQSPPVDEKL
jgi:hypothetical protein